MKHSIREEVSPQTLSSIAIQRFGWSTYVSGQPWTAALPAQLPDARLTHIAAQGQHPGSSDFFGTLVLVAHILSKKLGVESVFDLSMPISAFTRLREVYELAVAEECEARDEGKNGSDAIADFLLLVDTKFWTRSECDGSKFELPRDRVPAARIESKDDKGEQARVPPS